MGSVPSWSASKVYARRCVGRLKGVFSMARKWIQGAIKRPGALSKQAKGAGKSVKEFVFTTLKKGSKASATTKRRARLATTLAKLRRRKK